MKLFEHQGKELFAKYFIPFPSGALWSGVRAKIPFAGPFVVKAQTLAGDRKKAGGILFAKTPGEAKRKVRGLVGRNVGGETVRKVLVEEKIPSVAEYYCSLSYDTTVRGPVLALSPRGGSGVRSANVVPIDITAEPSMYVFREALAAAGFPGKDIPQVAGVLSNLWRLFTREYAVLAEINPLIKTPGGRFVAADAKVIIDDEKIAPSERRFLDLGGDIAILASGGGASLLNIDALLFEGGRPANYTEYSGNPPASVVADLTKRVLARQGLKGCWVVGGTANFTDIYETMRGFLEGLRAARPRPRYPFVIRRDGPRQKEAFAMLEAAAKQEGYDFHLFGSETPMAETAKIITKLSYGRGRKNR
jgi:succinyl-CoA synthetase beta subunit